MTGSTTDENHECSQKVTLNTICIKLENIEKTIIEIKDFQTKFDERLDLHRQEVEAIRLNSAKYPTPKEVKDAMDKVNRHDLLFALLGSAIVAAWGFSLWMADKAISIVK